METAAGTAPARAATATRQIASSSCRRARRGCASTRCARPPRRARAIRPRVCRRRTSSRRSSSTSCATIPTDPGNPTCDRFVLSKGHAAPLLYAAWAEAGAFPVERLLTLRRIDSELEGHPTPHFPGTVAATGSLGQGLSVGVGAAWNAKQLDRRDQRLYVLLGDGEMAEGSVWEAVEIAAHYQLDNLVAIVDVNGLGQSQRTMYGHDTAGYAARFAAFGWHAIAIDGHDMARDRARPSTRPARCAASRWRSSRAPRRGRASRRWPTRTTGTARR